MSHEVRSFLATASFLLDDRLLSPYMYAHDTERESNFLQVLFEAFCSERYDT